MRLLLAIDDSVKTQEKALQFAIRAKADLTVLFVRDVTWNMFLGHDWLLGSDARADFMEWMRKEEGKTADSTLVTFREMAAGFAYNEIVVEGNVQQEVLREAGNGYDLLILSNPFFRGLERVRKAVPEIVAAKPCDIMLINREE